MIDRVCGYRPGFAVHTKTCDSRAHERLVAEVHDSIDPPLYRAVANDHELCDLYPCADCRGNDPVSV